LLKPLLEEARQIAEERKNWDSQKRIKHLNERIEKALDDPITEYLYRTIGREPPKSVDDLLLKDERGLPHHRFDYRPQYMDIALNEMREPYLKSFVKLYSSGTVRQKKVIIPTDRFLDRFSAYYRATMRYDVTLAPKNPVAIVFYGGPSHIITEVIKNVLETPLRIVYIQDIIDKGFPDIGPVDLVVAISSYLDVALSKGLKLADEADVIYTGEPLSSGLRAHLESLGCRVFSLYASSETRISAFGYDGEMEITPEVHQITISKPLSFEEETRRETMFIWDYNEMIKDKLEGLVKPYYTFPCSPLLANVDVGDMVRIVGKNELGIPKIGYVTRANKFVKNYPIPPYGKADVIISPYMRHGSFFLPIALVKEFMRIKGARFFMLYYPNKGFVIITDAPVKEEELLYYISKDRRADTLSAISNKLKVKIVYCPEAVRAYFKEHSKKRYEGVILIRRKEFNEKAPCASDVVF